MIAITAELLAELAGVGAYERGRAYFLDGRVTAIETNAGRTVATVSGTQLYQVELRHTQSRLDGACMCPASEGIDFCKHCVAVALVLRDCQVAGALPQPGDEAATLAAYLARQSRDALVAELVGILPRVPEIRERVLLQAQLAAGPISAKNLKQSVTKATRPRDLWEYGEVAAFFRRIELTLENIATVADQVSAEALLKIVLYGIERLNRALERVDDSGGFRFPAQQVLGELHSLALKRLDWPVERRAEHLIELALSDDGDQFDGVPHSYAETLGDAGLAAFYAGVESRLAALPELPPAADFEAKRPYMRLTHYLRERAEDAGDWDELIELEQRTATTAIDYERIAALHLRKGEPDGAAEWLMRADQLADKRRDHEALLWAEVHAERGDWDAAAESQRQIFERGVDYAEYRRLIGFAARTDREQSVRDAAMALLRRGAPDHWWRDEQYAYTLAQVLRDEQDWQGLLDVALRRIRNADRLLEIARWLAKPAPGEASAVYAQAIARLIDKKKKRSYQAAVRVLLEAKPMFDTVGADALHEYVAQLKEDHRRKRSFIAVLDHAIPSGTSISR